MMYPAIPPKIAIIDHNALACIGMADILETVMPGASIRPFLTFEELEKAGNLDEFVHFFVSAHVYIEHANFFLQQKHRSIVLTHGDNLPQLSGVITLNICQPVAKLIQDIAQMRQHQHGRSQMPPQVPSQTPQLSTRELEVLLLIVKGLINKEIADQLNISLTTVITHRKNLMDKLGIRTVSGLTIYALMNGLVQVGDK